MTESVAVSPTFVSCTFWPLKIKEGASVLGAGWAHRKCAVTWYLRFLHKLYIVFVARMQLVAITTWIKVTPPRRVKMRKEELLQIISALRWWNCDSLLTPFVFMYHFLIVVKPIWQSLVDVLWTPRKQRIKIKIFHLHTSSLPFRPSGMHALKAPRDSVILNPGSDRPVWFVEQWLF